MDGIVCYSVWWWRMLISPFMWIKRPLSLCSQHCTMNKSWSKNAASLISHFWSWIKGPQKICSFLLLLKWRGLKFAEFGIDIVHYAMPGSRWLYYIISKMNAIRPVMIGYPSSLPSNNVWLLRSKLSFSRGFETGHAVLQFSIS